MKGHISIMILALLIGALLPLNAMHGNAWVSCLIINANNDTTIAQIRTHKDFSAEGAIINNELRIKKNGGDSVSCLPLTSFKELILLNGKPGYTHYLSINNTLAPNQTGLYRVIEEGSCKLLYIETPGSAGKIVYIAQRDGAMYSTNMHPSSSQYFLYCNEQLSPVVVDDDLNLSPVSKPICLEVFKECKTLTEKLRTAKNNAGKINLLVRQFNNCR